MIYDKNYFLDQLRNGTSMDDMGQALAAAMNEAQEAYAVERAEKERALANAQLAEAKRDLALELIDVIQEYGHLVAPDAADILDAIDDDDIDVMIHTLDEMFTMMNALATLKSNLDMVPATKAQTKSSINSDDEVLSNFIKSLM